MTFVIEVGNKRIKLIHMKFYVEREI